ncbi:DUF167 domain-containing protein [Candidatus Saccharibacteria bacterium]|nr:DUF167 domain-containing protein [Candidatus Saccharibacteria bacterium]
MLYEVSVKTGQKRESIEIVPPAENSLETPPQIVVKTTKHPVKNEANQAVIKALSKHFHTGKTNIRILKGETSKTKLIEIL